MVPYVAECITALRDFIQSDMGNNGVNANIKKMHGEVIRHIVKNSLRSAACWKKFEERMKDLKSDITILNFKRIVNELIVYHSDFLTYIAFNWYKNKQIDIFFLIFG